jgi:ABC-2 type transport system permease protein
MLGLLLRRRARCAANALGHLTAYERARNALFGLAGFGLLYGLYDGFSRVLAYLATVELIGPLLLWKLTAMLLLMTLSMVVVSSLLTSLTTLFYSYDLKFLMKSPVSLRVVFLDKSLESAFFSSWMIGLVLVPFVLAQMRVLHLGPSYFAAFALALPPFLLLAASFGIAFTLLLLYLFPSSRTRDVVWVLSSLSMSVMYVLVRFAQPEKLIRPDMLKVVAEYLNFLQAPTAPYLPSWWFALGLQAAAGAHWGAYALQAAALWGASFAVYGGLVALAGKVYFTGYSGAQEGALRKRTHEFSVLPEQRLFGPGRLSALLWKERVSFFRDVKHWSQMLLIVGLVFVYLFSISRLPHNAPEFWSLIAFLNVGTAGFVLAALGLRFTFPAISLEGRGWWILKSSPLTVGQIMRQKFLFSLAPTLAVALILGLMTTRFIGADRFTTAASVAALLGIAVVLCGMGVGLGALFPRFHVENIHQIESSMGGFVYMAAGLFYIGATLSILAWPMRMHFMVMMGNPRAWDGTSAAVAAGMWAALSAASFAATWTLGRRALENHEE